MDIAIISGRLNLETGGGGSYAINSTARELERRGHDVTVTLLEPPDGRRTELPYRVHDVPGDRTDPASKLVRTYEWMMANQFDYDLYHIYGPRYAPAGGLYRARGGETPVVATFNGYFFCTNYSRMNRTCYKNCTIRKKFNHSSRSGLSNASMVPYYVYNRIGFPRLCNRLDRIVAVSPTVKGMYVENGINGQLVEIIPHFIETSFAGEGTKTADDHLRIIYVGRLERFKGVRFLFGAMERAVFDEKKVRVDIVGDGSEREALERRAESLDHDIVFHGHVDHSAVGDLYANSDVFVHPGTLPEPFGLTVIEAMQHETVPVVSDCGAPPWIVGDAGLTFEWTDESDLADRLEELSDDTVLNAYAARCSEELRRFEPEVISEQHDELYKNLL